ncbi:MAG: peptidylprolyl isomerase [Methyloceanibacter sp.]|uniref:peptidylprolyl isomerase n=1 Tax=Methyloceanibacter sp. TaxID=1965321 RepID=UPI003C591F72
MKLWSALLLLAASMSFVPLAHAADPVVARVNGFEIKQSDLDFAASEVGPRLGTVRPEDRKRVLMQFMIENELFAGAGEQEKLDESDTFDKRAAYHRRRALRDAFFDKNVRGAVDDAEAKKVFEENISKLKPEQEISARHILVDTEDEAKEVKAQLEGGSDFAKLAAEKSKDKNAEGGSLGFFSRGQMLKPFEDAAFALDVGKLSEPVKTSFGWHIIEIQEKRNQELPSFDDVKDPIISQLVVRKAQSVVGDLRSKAKIEILDPEIKRSMDDAAMRGEAPPLPDEEFKDEN